MPQSTRAKQLSSRWMEMWHGDLDAATEIFAENCVAYPAPTTIGEPPVYWGPAELRRLVEQGRAIFRDVTFRALDKPIVEGDRLACRWTCEGTYLGGMPGASTEPGAPITFGGIDVWRLENGKVAEYWVASDGLHLMARLGIGG